MENISYRTLIFIKYKKCLLKVIHKSMTNNKLQAILKRANTEVEEVGITDPELKKIAFAKAVDFYLYDQTKQPQTNPQRVVDNVPAGGESPVDFWGLLEESTGIETKKLKDVYSIRGDQISLVLSSITGKTKADKQRNLAVLVLLAYQEGLSREW